MESLDTTLRLMVIGQIGMVIIVLAARGPRRITAPLILLQVSVIAFLIKSSPVLSNAMSFAQFPIWLLTVASSYFVWICAATLFDLARPPKWALITFPILTLNCAVYPLVSGSTHPVAEIIGLGAAVIIVLHAVYSVHKGNLDDLFEPRRRYRLCFISCIALSSAYIMLSEIVFIGRELPTWVPLTNTILIACVLLAISVPMLARPADLLPEPDPDQTPPPNGRKSELSIIDQQIHSALQKAMDNRAYARTGLTIRQLAQELKTPEHQLRALINQRLGFKNFSAFLNGYRIREACARLADPEQIRTQILTIALDTGFASLAPFNRAFRAHTGMTPTEFRRSKLTPQSNVAQLRR